MDPVSKILDDTLWTLHYHFMTLHHHHHHITTSFRVKTKQKDEIFQKNMVRREHCNSVTWKLNGVLPSTLRNWVPEEECFTFGYKYFSFVLHIMGWFDTVQLGFATLWEEKHKCNSVTFMLAPFWEFKFLDDGSYHVKFCK